MGMLAERKKPETKAASCGLGVAYEAMDDDDKAWIDDKLRPDSGWTNREIADEMAGVGISNGRGQPISMQVVQRHRGGACSCG